MKASDILLAKSIAIAGLWHATFSTEKHQNGCFQYNMLSSAGELYIKTHAVISLHDCSEFS
jgi:hypothetical protein